VGYIAQLSGAEDGIGSRPQFNLETHLNLDALTTPLDSQFEAEISVEMSEK
jgi:hypothetical protein